MQQTILEAGDFSGAVINEYLIDDLAMDELGMINKAMLFLYLYRRFGAPLVVSGDHHIIAEYYLTTDMPGVMLRVSIGMCYTFGIAVRANEYKRNSPVPGLFFTEFEILVTGALRRAIMELLKPQAVRDSELTAISWE